MLVGVGRVGERAERGGSRVCGGGNRIIAVRIIAMTECAPLALWA